MHSRYLIVTACEHPMEKELTKWSGKAVQRRLLPGGFGDPSKLRMGTDGLLEGGMFGGG